MRLAPLLSLTALATALATPAHAACPPPADAGAPLAAGPVQLAWRADPPAILVGQPIVLVVTVCPATAQLMRVLSTSSRNIVMQARLPALFYITDAYLAPVP